MNSRKNKKNHKLEQRKLQTFFQVKKKPIVVLYIFNRQKKSLITLMMTDMKQKKNGPSRKQVMYSHTYKYAKIQSVCVKKIRTKKNMMC